MTTLSAYVKAAIDLLGEPIGRYVPITSLTTTTAVSTSLAFGGNSEQRYAQWWMWRPDTATAADRDRNADSFAPATGTLTHSGTNYGDTTATSETLILLQPHFDPYKVRYACDRAIRQMREYDETEIPARRLSNGEYHLADLSWLEDAASIREVRARVANTLSRNRDVQKWHQVNTSGVLSPPDFFVLAGTSATITRGTTNIYDGPYVATLTRVGNDCTMLQTVGILPTGVVGDSLRGREVTAVLRVRATAASRVRVRIYENGSATASSSFHTGGSTYELLTCTATIASTTDTLTFGASLETGDTAVNIAECYLVDGATPSDTDLRDDQWSHSISTYQFEQGGPLKLQTFDIGFPAQFLICSERPFPGFDATRLASGAADLDESDAPVLPVATGIITILMEGYLGMNHQDAVAWRRKFDAMKLKHMSIPTEKGGGMQLLSPPFAGSPMRVR